MSTTEKWNLLDTLTALSISLALFGTASELRATARRLRPFCDEASNNELLSTILVSSKPVEVLKRCLAELKF